MAFNAAVVIGDTSNGKTILVNRTESLFLACSRTL